MVEEMAEQHSSETYDNYKFLTVPELKNLSLDHLIGKTSLLRPYMHGFFVANRLHEEARLISNPFVYEEVRAQRIQERVEKERASRIRSSKVGLSNRKKTKLAVLQNQKLVDSLEEKERTKGEPLTDGSASSLSMNDLSLTRRARNTRHSIPMRGQERQLRIWRRSLRRRKKSGAVNLVGESKIQTRIRVAVKTWPLATIILAVMWTGEAQTGTSLWKFRPAFPAVLKGEERMLLLPAGLKCRQEQTGTGPGRARCLGDRR